MIKTVLARWQQGFRTMVYPDGPCPPLPDRYRGRPRVDTSSCPVDCRLCLDVCPTAAISFAGENPRRAVVDLGKCLFCTDCVRACPSGAIVHESDHRLSTRRREELCSGDEPLKLAEPLDARARKLFGRSLRLRQVCAGGCNACEADTNVLGTVAWDIGRFGIQFVASPRHADGLLVTGPVSENMKLALEKTYQAVPDPKIVVVVGACAISGGPFADHPEVRNGVGSIVPIDLHIPGCPPHPLTILDGLLRILGRLDHAM